MKKIKKCISILLVVVMVVMVSSQAIWAKNLSVEPELTYVLEKNTVVETLEFIDTDGILVKMQTRVFPNGNAIFSTTKGAVTSTEHLRGRDYDLLYQLATRGFNENIHVPQARGSEITGSQYKHVFIGKSTYSISKSEFSNTSSLTGILVGILAGSTAGTVYGIAAFMVGLVASGADHYTITDSVYEVRRTYDNSYYIHCYHSFVKAYDSGNHLLDSFTEYRQAIGG